MDDTGPVVASRAIADARTLPPVATFSLVALDRDTGDLGVAVASKFLAVGAYVPTAVAGVGAVASQAHVNTTFGTRAVTMLQEGKSPEACVEAFEASDEGMDSRQLGIVAADGRSVSFTGGRCHAWAGGVTGDGFAAQGNILAGPAVVDALVETLSRAELPFPERLVAALEAADAAGGDRRGRESAALVVVGEGKGYAGLTDRWIDLRVDDHPRPITELGRLLELHRLFMNTPSRPARDLSEGDIRWLQERLRARGYLQGAATGTWSDATRDALEALFGVENLEERWLEGPRVDPVAWRHLKDVLANADS